MKYRTRILLFSLIPFLACNPQPIGNQKAIAEEIESREIKRVTKVDILRETTDRGTEIITLLSSLSSDSTNLTSAVDSINSMPLGKLKFYSIDADSDEEGLEAEILEAYQYAAEENIKPETNVEDLEDGTLLYASPVFSNTDNENNSTLIGLWSIRFSKKEIIKGME